MPAWTRVAVSGVSQTGASASSPAIPPTRAGMKPPQIAADLRPAQQADASSQAAVVTAARTIVTRAACQRSGGLNSDELDLLDSIIFVARRHRDFDLVADDAADQRAAERRDIADPADLGVGLGLADDLVLDRLVVLVEQVTVAPNTTLSPDRVVGSMISARLSRSSMSAIVASTWPWRSLAA